MTHERFQKCIDICNKCAMICEHYATECLHEDNIKAMLRCIELDRVCVETCRSTSAIMA